MIKRITIIGANYYPEDSAIGLYTTQKAEYLLKKGFEVTMVTGFPYYPQWEIWNDYKLNSYYINENINGVQVYRYKQYVPQKPTFTRRIIHLLSFTLGSVPNIFKGNKPDLVIVIIPFTTTALLGWILKVVYKSKLWIHIQDFEFDAAMDSGLLKKNQRIFKKILIWIERKLFSKADIISTISFSMLKKLKKKTNTNTFYLTNWIDSSKFKIDQTKKHPFLSSNKFKLLYSGNIGAKQDWDFFIALLEKVQNIDVLEVIIVGEGAEKSALIEKVAAFNFVKHYNLVPYDELPLLLSSADVHFLFQKQDVIDTVMPSKLLGMMASAKPSIVTGNLESEVANVFKESQAGFYFGGNSIDEIEKGLLELINNSKLRHEMGFNARKYVTEKYAIENVLDRFVKKLQNF